MANLTVSVSEGVLKRARIRALQDNTSVNAVLNRFLEEYAREDEIRRRREKALESLLAIAEESQAGRGGKTWTRDDLHEE